MATDHGGIHATVTAGAAVLQYELLKGSSTSFIKTAASGEIGVCVAQEGAASGAKVDVVVSGTTKAIAGAAIAAVGTWLMSAADGKVVAWTTTNEPIGWNLTAAAALNDVIEIVLAPTAAIS